MEDDGVPNGDVDADPEPKNVVIGSFSREARIMRRVSKRDRHNDVLPKNVLEGRKTRRGASLKESDVRYFRHMAGEIEKLGESRALCNLLAAHGKPPADGFRDFDDMQNNKYARQDKRKRQRHAMDDRALNNEVKPFKKNKTIDTRIPPLIDRLHPGLVNVMSELTTTSEQMKYTSGNEVRKLGNAYQRKIVELREKSDSIYRGINREAVDMEKAMGS